MTKRLEIKLSILIILLIVLLAGNSCLSPETNPYTDYVWTSKIRDDHPRLFFNKSIFKQVKGRALNEEKVMFDEMKTRVDDLIGQKIEFKEPYVADGTQNSDHEYGLRAAESAFLYKVLKEEKYLRSDQRAVKSCNRLLQAEDRCKS